LQSNKQKIVLPNYKKFEADITEILKSGLDKRLHYHGFHHVEYVMDAALLISSASNLSDREITLLKTAVLLHDSGFIRTYVEHEVIGTEIAKEMLPGYGYSDADIETINGMILATRIPQTATNHLEEIIADADLEYLGTNKFKRISEYLYHELIDYKFINNRDEWNRIQMRFLKAHTYFTNYCKKHREHEKQENLTKIMKLI
jgi:HD superfamily phosphodiesterase